MAGFDPPQVLVLGGGGILGEAWMTAVIAGVEEASGFDARACEGFVGTSAGSIVAAVLAAGIDPRSRLGELPEQPPVPVSELAGEPSAFARALELGRRPAAPRPPRWRWWGCGPPSGRAPCAARCAQPGPSGTPLARAARARARRGRSALGRPSRRLCGGGRERAPLLRCSAPPARRRPRSAPRSRRRARFQAFSGRLRSTAAATSTAACGVPPTWIARPPVAGHVFFA